MRLPVALALSALVAMPAAAQDSPVFGAELLSVSVSGDVSFSLKTPAYVAVFELIRGRGITQMYPATDGGARQAAATGTTWIPGYQTAFYRRASAWNASWSATNAVWSAANSRWDRISPFRTYVLIASDKPLNIGSPLATASALRRVEGWQPLSMNGIGPGTFDALIEAVRPTIPGAIIETDALEAVYRPPSAGTLSEFADETGIDLVCFDGNSNFILTIPRSAIFNGLGHCRNANTFAAVPLLTGMGPQRQRPDGSRDSSRVRSAPVAPAVPAVPAGQTGAGGVHVVSSKTMITDPGEIGRAIDDLRRTSGRTEAMPGIPPGSRTDDAGRVDAYRIAISESGRSGAGPTQREPWRGDDAAADRNARGKPMPGSNERSAASPAYSAPPPSPPPPPPPPPRVMERPSASQPTPARADPRRDIERKP